MNEIAQLQMFKAVLSQLGTSVFFASSALKDDSFPLASRQMVRDNLHTNICFVSRLFENEYLKEKVFQISQLLIDFPVFNDTDSKDYIDQLNYSIKCFHSYADSAIADIENKDSQNYLNKLAEVF